MPKTHTPHKSSKKETRDSAALLGGESKPAVGKLSILVTRDYSFSLLRETEDTLLKLNELRGKVVSKMNKLSPEERGRKAEKAVKKLQKMGEAKAEQQKPKTIKLTSKIEAHEMSLAKAMKKAEIQRIWAEDETLPAVCIRMNVSITVKGEGEDATVLVETEVDNSLKQATLNEISNEETFSRLPQAARNPAVSSSANLSALASNSRDLVSALNGQFLTGVSLNDDQEESRDNASRGASRGASGRASGGASGRASGGASGRAGESYA